jgi:hypothetical protein
LGVSALVVAQQKSAIRRCFKPATAGVVIYQTA